MTDDSFPLLFARDIPKPDLKKIPAHLQEFWTSSFDRSPCFVEVRRSVKGRKTKTIEKFKAPPFYQDPSALLRRIGKRMVSQFGLHSFRPGQEQAIRAIAAKKDVLATMPTGAGKSLIYQLPAFELEGVTVVVSPLLALMRDQEQKLRRTGVVAARLDSTMSVKETTKTLDAIEGGRRKILYVTPERLAKGQLQDELGGQPVSLFVVDEAHCVSEWGHDFRPSYLMLSRSIEQLGRPVICALTATATPAVADDIIARLGMLDPVRVHHGFDRPSLRFSVYTACDEKAQIKYLIRLLRKIHGPVIIYCSTIRTVEAVAKTLPVLGIATGMYHGKMSKADRDQAQHDFMKNRPKIMVATNAFGLGVDKPDIRAVVHYNMPGNIEAYYQEAGRAGRDGKPSLCVLLYNVQDQEVQEFFVGGKFPGKADFAHVWQAIVDGARSLREVSLAAQVSQAKTRVVIEVLKELGLCQEAAGQLMSATGKEVDELLLSRAADTYRVKREGEHHRLTAMIDYAESKRCRMQLLMEYFGEKTPDLCKRCDNCRKYGKAAETEATDELLDFEHFTDDGADTSPAVPRKDSVFF